MGTATDGLITGFSMTSGVLPHPNSSFASSSVFVSAPQESPASGAVEVEVISPQGGGASVEALAWWPRETPLAAAPRPRPPRPPRDSNPPRPPRPPREPSYEFLPPRAGREDWNESFGAADAGS